MARANYRRSCVALTAFLTVSFMASVNVSAQQKPNILLIMSDDVGISNISAYSRGLVGYQTPNIDRLAKEGLLFTDYYAEQSCTAGRSAFILGQSPVRTGLTKVQQFPARRELAGFRGISASVFVKSSVQQTFACERGLGIMLTSVQGCFGPF